MVLCLVGSTGWCNGSTKDFGPFCLGSNPSPVIDIYRTFVYTMVEHCMLYQCGIA